MESVGLQKTRGGVKGGGRERNGSALCLKYLAKWDSFYSPFIAVRVMGSWVNDDDDKDGGHFLVGSIVIFDLADYNTRPSKLVSTYLHYEESAQTIQSAS